MKGVSDMLLHDLWLLCRDKHERKHFYDEKVYPLYWDYKHWKLTRIRNLEPPKSMRNKRITYNP